MSAKARRNSQRTAYVDDRCILCPLMIIEVYAPLAGIPEGEGPIGLSIDFDVFHGVHGFVTRQGSQSFPLD